MSCGCSVRSFGVSMSSTAVSWMCFDGVRSPSMTSRRSRRASNSSPETSVARRTCSCGGLRDELEHAELFAILDELARLVEEFGVTVPVEPELVEKARALA